MTRAFARRGLSRVPYLALLTIVLWQVVDWLDPSMRILLASPTDVVGALTQVAMSGELVTNVVASVARVFVGFFIGAALGVGLGVLVGSQRVFGSQVHMITELIRPVPPIAWIPLAILWFGPGDRAPVFIVALGCIFPILISTGDAVRAIPATYLRVAQSFGASHLQKLTDVIIPSILPRVFTGLRVGLGVAWTSVIAAELTGAQSGLGYMIQTSGVLLQTADVLLGMALIGLIGLGMSAALVAVESRIVPWTRVSR